MENEKRLIDSCALLETLQKKMAELNERGLVSSYLDGFNEAFRAIFTAPTVDAVEVVHARWVRYEHGSGIYCSHCRHKRRYRDAHDNYCPNCGAKMDGGNEDA